MTATGYDRGALYYPFIHVRDENWLKATLLTFPYLKRIVPPGFEVNDGPLAADLAQRKSRFSRPMLDWADPTAWAGVERQLVVADCIDEDIREFGPGFLDRFSREAAARDYADGANAFQIRNEKIQDFLQHVGREEGREISWAPEMPNRGADGWLSVHPILGEVLMSASAIGLAEQESLDIVTNEVSITEAAASMDARAIYRALVHDEPPLERVEGATMVNDLCRFVITSQFDLSLVDADTLAELNAAHADLSALKARLAEMVAGVPETLTREVYEDHLREKAQQVVGEWEARAASVGGFFGRITGLNILDNAEGYVSNVATDVVAAGAVGATGAAVIGNLPGLIVGVIFHMGRSAVQEARKGANSPFRYLSKLRASGAHVTALVPPGASS